MAAAIEAAYSTKVVLKPGGRGDFIVTFEKQILWNKRKEGDQFPKEDEMLHKLKTILKSQS